MDKIIKVKWEVHGKDHFGVVVRFFDKLFSDFDGRGRPYQETVSYALVMDEDESKFVEVKTNRLECCEMYWSADLK